MSQASVTFQLGAESVTSVLDIDLPTGGTPLVGDVSGTFGDCFVAGDLNLTGNLFVEGVMTGIDTFHVQGNGFTIFFQNGGQVDLHGKFKAPWGPWGTDTTGWVASDRLAVAPTKKGVFVPSELAWSNWLVARPVNSPDVTLLNGTIRKPEVVNLSQSIVFENLSRGFHFHDSAGVQRMSDVKFLNCGTPLILGNYPVHFHMNGDNTRGSLLERVVVEGGKNHAFVPHASHGITLKDCVAYKIFSDAYWWDRQPPGTSGPAARINDSHDSDWDHCLALWVLSTPGGGIEQRLTGFMLGDGDGNRIADTVASCVQGGDSAAGYHWPEGADGVWDSQRMVAHNNKSGGIRVWQNGSTPGHDVLDFIGFRNGIAGISHGAYKNTYKYRRAILQENGVRAMGVSALSSNASPDDRLLFEDILTDGPLRIAGHNQPTTNPTVYRRVNSFTQVILAELSEEVGGFYWFEDDGLTPAFFDLSGVKPESVIEIFEGGVLVHRWAAGAWT